MIKRTMYFYDKKQADLIKKVNDKLHRQRGVKVEDADIKNLLNNTKKLNSISMGINDDTLRYKIFVLITDIENSLTDENVYNRKKSDLQNKAQDIITYMNNYQAILKLLMQLKKNF